MWRQRLQIISKETRCTDYLVMFSASVSSSINCTNKFVIDRITLRELFPGFDHEEILRLNKKCDINHSLSILNLYKCPLSAIDLISKMLKVVP